MTKVCLGIPCFQSADWQVLDDYMRLAFHIGRRNPDIELMLGVKGKSEQFRARNAIVKAALQNACDYIWMLDDDHIIDLDGCMVPSVKYNILHKMLTRMEENECIGVLGALYWQRGGDYLPVMMQENEAGQPHFLHPSEVAGGMQKVDVTGGGCILIRCKVFDRICEPWFGPEHEYGTDIQLCKQVRDAGWEVWCDTSLEIGHLRMEREVLSSAKLKRAFREVKA